ncbi:MAG TPA: hypothetical protein VII72_05670 [Myxococcota bacterium]
MSDGSAQRGGGGSPGLASALVRGLDWFIPESVRAEGAEVRERARLLVGVCAIVLAFFALVAGFEWTQGTAWIAGIALVFGSLFAGLPLLLRATGMPRLAANLAALLIFVFGISMVAVTRGESTAAHYTVAMVPLIAALLGGSRTGIVWATATLAGLLAVSSAIERGAPLPLRVAPSEFAFTNLRATGVLIFVTLAIALTYERLERRAFQEAAAARAEAEEQRKRIEREVKLRELLERREQERGAPPVRA